MLEVPRLLSLTDELDRSLGVSDFSLSLLSGGDRLAKRIKREGKVPVLTLTCDSLK